VQQFSDTTNHCKNLLGYSKLHRKLKTLKFTEFYVLVRSKRYVYQNNVTISSVRYDRILLSYNPVSTQQH